MLLTTHIMGSDIVKVPCKMNDTEIGNLKGEGVEISYPQKSEIYQPPTFAQWKRSQTPK